MEAKDKKAITEEILRKFSGTDPEMDIDWEMMEISFKAGFIEGQVDKGRTEAILRVANESLKEGRREVVEFLCEEGVVGTLLETLNRINKKFGKLN